MWAPLLSRTYSMQPDSSAFVADPELIRTLETCATPVRCDADCVLFNQDDTAVGVYILHEGRLR